jgi:hypothetical protein
MPRIRYWLHTGIVDPIYPRIPPYLVEAVDASPKHPGTLMIQSLGLETIVIHRLLLLALPLILLGAAFGGETHFVNATSLVITLAELARVCLPNPYCCFRCG